MKKSRENYIIPLDEVKFKVKLDQRIHHLTQHNTKRDSVAASVYLYRVTCAGAKGKGNHNTLNCRGQAATQGRDLNIASLLWDSGVSHVYIFSAIYVK